MIALPTALARTLVRATVLAALVGSVLVLINHGDHLTREPVCAGFYWKLSLSYAVPFIVSLVSTRLAHGDANRRSQAQAPRSARPCPPRSRTE